MQIVINHIGLILFLLTTFNQNSYSQTIANNWYFGEYAGLQFSSAPPQALLNSASYAVEGVSSWSDQEGNLLFYTSATTLFNRLHQPTPNGMFGFYTSAVQAPFICPNPENTEEFYLFSIEEIINSKLYYSIVSMSLDGGLGDIDSNRKQILLRDSLTEKITAAPKCDGTGFWVIVRDASNANVYVYSISNNGLDTVPVISQANQISGFGIGAGEIAISPDYEKIAICHNYESIIEFLDFDASTGQFSNPFYIDLNTPPNRAYGLEFSPSGDLLYCTLTDASIPFGWILQLNTSVMDSAAIYGSVDTIAASPGSFYTAQTGPDSKIYIAANDSFLHCINNPNGAGAASNFELNAVPLGGRLSRLGLPQFQQWALTNPIGERVICAGDTAFFSFVDSCSTGVEWDFDDPGSAGNISTANPTYHVFSDTGTYQVSLDVTYTAATKTFSNVIRIVPAGLPDIFPDTVFACDSSIRADISLVNYLWSNGDTSRTLQLDSSGLYSLTISNQCDTASESFYAVLLQAPQISLPIDTFLCGDAEIELTAPVLSYTSLLWSTGESTPTITVDSTANNDSNQINLWVVATNPCGIAGDSMIIRLIPIPLASLPSDTNLCDSASFYIFHDNAENVNYTWNDTIKGPSLYINSTSISWLVAENECGVSTDTFNAVFYPKILIDLGLDTILCASDTIVLDASWPNANYNWNTGDTDPVIEISSPGDYIVTVSVPPCQATSSRKVFANEDRCPTQTCAFTIPNIFTPNGDGINDQLRITSQCPNQPFQVTVYNRWGQLIFSGASMPHGLVWDGYVNGSLASAGTYFLTVLTNEGTTLRNTITVIH